MLRLIYSRLQQFLRQAGVHGMFAVIEVGFWAAVSIDAVTLLVCWLIWRRKGKGSD
jgi:O-antigen/teichoic acid export membrane protein